MPRYSTRSSERLETCDPRLQQIFRELIKDYDCSIVCGHRNAKDQNAAFNAVPPNSKVEFPNSEHNDCPSRAVDAVPYPYAWDSRRQFYYMHGRVQSIADRLKVGIRWGGDWDGDFDFDDNGFMDLGHWELTDD